MLTPADVVRRHASYNETSYSAFVQGVAERRGERCAGGQRMPATSTWCWDGAGRSSVPAAIFQGVSRFNAGSNDGRGGTLSVNLLASNEAMLEIATQGVSAGSGSGATLFDSALNAFRPETMLIGGVLRRDATTYSLEGSAQHRGAQRRHPDGAGSAAVGCVRGKGILVEQGASIDTLAGADPSRVAQPTAPYLVSGGLLAVSNQRLTALSAQGGSAAGPVAIDIGGCEVDCSGQTRLLSAGSINVVTDGALNIGDAVSYGTRQLGLGMSALNLGSAEAIATAAAAGGLPAGMTMNQEVLQRLLRGNTATATGAPALEALSLTARDAINVFGSVDLDTRDSATGRSSLRSLVLGALPFTATAALPTARASSPIRWSGTVRWPAPHWPAVSRPNQPARRWWAGLAKGSWRSIRGCWSWGVRPSRSSSTVAADRQVLGFAGVTLAASDRMLFSGKGSLDVFQRQGDYVAGSGWQLNGGALDIVTPLLTGNAGAQLAIRNGGTVQLRGAAATTGSDALGAELSITAERIGIDSRVALASGRFEANARQGMTLGSNAVLDMAGRKVSLFDVDKYSWGGDVALTSREGDIVADTGSRIDLSARNNRGVPDRCCTGPAGRPYRSGRDPAGRRQRSLRCRWNRSAL